MDRSTLPAIAHSAFHAGQDRLSPGGNPGRDRGQHLKHPARSPDEP